MNLSTQTGLVGFLLALSALPISSAIAANPSASTPTDTATMDTAATVEARLTRLTGAIRQLETQLPQEVKLPAEMQVAYGFANRSGGGGFVNGPGGGFANGWRNGGGFLNRW